MDKVEGQRRSPSYSERIPLLNVLKHVLPMFWMLLIFKCIGFTIVALSRLALRVFKQLVLGIFHAQWKRVQMMVLRWEMQGMDPKVAIPMLNTVESWILQGAFTFIPFELFLLRSFRISFPTGLSSVVSVYFLWLLLKQQHLLDIHPQLLPRNFTLVWDPNTF